MDSLFLTQKQFTLHSDSLCIHSLTARQVQAAQVCTLCYSSRLQKNICVHQMTAAVLFIQLQKCKMSVVTPGSI